MNRIFTQTITLILCLLFCTAGLHAQAEYAPEPAPKLRKNAVYAEIGGSSMMYSISYERQLYKSKGDFSHIAMRVGVGVFPVNQVQFVDSSSNNTYINPAWAFPIEAMYYFGRERHKMDFSFGWTPMAVILHLRSPDPINPGNVFIRPEYHFFHIIAPGIGYRYESPVGFFLKAGIVVQMMFYGTKSANPPAFPYPKLCLGYRF